MFFKKCDLLSPVITLYFKGFSLHSSILSGILTIICYSITFSLGIYYTIIFIYKENPNIYFYTKYVEDAGIFPFNSSSIFHYIGFGDTNDRSIKNIDFESIRIFGIEYSIDIYVSNNNLLEYNHWLYGPCNNNDINNLEYLINQDFPEKGACIRQYFDVEKQKYYNTSEDNFKWPTLSHGCSNGNAINYGIIIEKCTNNSLQNNCKSNSEFDSYLKHLYAILYFVDNYAQLLNYREPYVKYLYKLTNGLFADSFTVNNLNFNPSIISSNDGLLVKKHYLDKSYQYTQNEKTISENSNNTNIIICFYFWMQNTMQYYDRNYETFQELLSDIGGINSFIILIANIINSLWVNFIILLDTEELLLNSDKQNFKKTNYKLKPTFLKKASQILNPPKLFINKNISKKNSINDKQHSSIYQILLNDKYLKLNKFNNIDAKSEPFKKQYFKNNNKLDINRNVTNKIVNNNNISNNKYSIIYNSKNDNSNKNLINNNSINKSIKESINALETKNKEEKYKPITKQNFTWFNYLFYVITCKLKNPKINYYENFRTQIISEENMIQNHLNIFKLMKACNLENIDPFKLNNYGKKIC